VAISYNYTLCCWKEKDYLIIVGDFEQIINIYLVDMNLGFKIKLFYLDRKNINTKWIFIWIVTFLGYYSDTVYNINGKIDL